MENENYIHSNIRITHVYEGIVSYAKISCLDKKRQCRQVLWYTKLYKNKLDNYHLKSSTTRMLSMSFPHAANCLNSFLLSVNYTCPSLKENRKSSIFPYLHY